MKAKRELTQAAQVAKIIKAGITARGYKCRVKSDNYSMGSSVDIYVENMRPDVFKEIEKEFEVHEYGTFDGMTDCSGYKNQDFKGPQAKHVFFHNQISDDVKQAAWEILRAKYSHDEDEGEPPLLLKDARNYRLFGEWADSLVYRELAAGFDDVRGMGREFWEKHCAKPEARRGASSQEIGSTTFRTSKELKTAVLSSCSSAPSRINTATSSAAEIQEHTHTKHGFLMFLVVLSDRVSPDTFAQLRTTAAAAGGWYSRQWGSTPGGFAFKDKEAAQAFAASCFSEPVESPTEPATDSAPAARAQAPNHSEKLRAAADAMAGKIADKFAPRLENTQKRLAQAAHARLEGERLKRTQQALYRLAGLWDLGEVPQVLQHIKKASEVYACMSSERQMVQNGFHTYHVETGKPTGRDALTVALWALLDARSEKEENAERLRIKLNALQFSSIPGYFPTPSEIVDRMTIEAELSPGLRVLEPSAGSGNICRAIVEAGARCVAFEHHSSLCEVLQLQGIEAEQTDFLTVSPGADLFDRVLMNPPFEGMQDADHVRHAFEFLKPGGRLVAIMSPGPFFRSDRKAAEFRAWAEFVGARVVDLPAGAFKESGTGVASKLVVIDALPRIVGVPSCLH